MTRCVIDAAALHSVEQAYDALARELSLPAHFGRNLDALWDCLATDVKGPVEIVWRNESKAPPAMVPFLGRLRRLLEEAAGARRDLRFRAE